MPKDGGNTVLQLPFFTFSNESLQGDNYTDELRQAGLPTPNRIVKNWDLNESLGGPFKRDKVWFWFSTRYNESENQGAVFRNRNEYDPTKCLYDPDTSQPGVNKGWQSNNSIRVTWQATPRNKIAGTYKFDKWCNCPNNISATRRPKPGAIGASRAWRRNTSSGRRRSRTACCSKQSDCISTSAGATCTIALTADRSKIRASRRFCRNSLAFSSRATV